MAYLRRRKLEWKWFDRVIDSRIALRRVLVYLPVNVHAKLADFVDPLDPVRNRSGENR
jgi:hypothetical protein